MEAPKRAIEEQLGVRVPKHGYSKSCHFDAGINGV